MNKIINLLIGIDKIIPITLPYNQWGLKDIFGGLS